MERIISLKNEPEQVIENLCYQWDNCNDPSVKGLTDENGELDYEKVENLSYSETFNIEMREDGDYRFYDPFREYYKGYLDPNGWSNWTLKNW